MTSGSQYPRMFALGALNPKAYQPKALSTLLNRAWSFMGPVRVLKLLILVDLKSSVQIMLLAAKPQPQTLATLTLNPRDLKSQY